MNWKRFILWLAVVMMFLVPSADAYVDSVERIGMLKSPAGHPLVLEEMNIDAVVVTIKYLQIRNQYGVVIAKAERVGSLGYYCPDLDFCWVFAYKGSDILGNPMRLDNKHLNYEEKPEGGLSEEMVHYLAGKNKRLRGIYSPELDTVGFVPMPALKWAMPFIILANHPVEILANLVGGGLLAFLGMAFWLYQRRKKWMTRIVGFVLGGAGLCIGFLGVWSLPLISGVPLFYEVVAITAGVLLGITLFCRRNKPEKQG